MTISQSGRGSLQPQPAGAADDLSAAAPPGLASLSREVMSDLRRATARLVQRNGAAADAELARFKQIRDRTLAVDHSALFAAHTGRTVVVTGGTGCIGSALIGELTRVRPGRIISVSRGLESGWPRFDDVEYVHVDVRDRGALLELFADVRPHIVYHLAAQHDPGLAEREPHRTLSTNVLGTANVAQACRLTPGTRLACASTGKALRPFSSDIYAASKKMTEWILGNVANQGDLAVSAVRFTHVVDNSIILHRLYDWSAAGAAIRLHSADTMFYLQSAREAAQLLMSSVLEMPMGGLALGAIRDLGWPISLLDLALGVVSSERSESPLYLCGFEAGYEEAPYPGLYDPQISGMRSPLFSALEAFAVADSNGCAAVDVYRVPPVSDDRVGKLIDNIGEPAAGMATAELRGLVDECGWIMLEESLRLLPTEVVARHSALLQGRYDAVFSADDARVRCMVEMEASHRVRHGLFSAPDLTPRTPDTW